MSGGWAGSTRRARLPKDWPTIRARILDRDGHACTWQDDGHRCGVLATEVDHVRRGDDHRDANLRSLCTYHHRRKTGREGQAAGPKPPTIRRPAERHPGLAT